MKPGSAIKKYCCVLILFALSTVVHSQQLKGRVFEITAKNDTAALPGAVLRWMNTAVGTTTDTEGKFSIGKTASTNILIVSYTGYENDTMIIDTTRKFVSFFLSSNNTLKEVEVVYHSSGSDFSYMNPIKVETLGQRELAKAACCNLSESFETNPSVDVNFADAVTGTKQIQMLGLSGQYALITKENMPYLRGLASMYGLTFIPGTWISSIQLSKGAGSVINGYESFTGQINTELQKPDKSEKLYFNAYVNQNARNEYNLNLAHKLNETWSTGLLAHFSVNPLKQDMNKDGFVDIPTGNQYNILHRWSYATRKGFEGQFGGNYVMDERFGGQMNFDSKRVKEEQAFYGIGIRSEKWDVFAKNGYVFKKPETSMGLQLSYLQHKQDNFYGMNTYKGYQETFYANYIFQGILKNTNHKYKVGASFLWDKVNEQYRQYSFAREEAVPGTFIEYTYSRLTRFNVVAGLRADYHNYYGLFFTPRVHARYASKNEKTVFRASAGRALKTANVFAENSPFMASSRDFIITPSDVTKPYGLRSESAWNFGVNFLQKFKLNFRDAQFVVDVYRTDFTDQVVVDIDFSPKEVHIFNLEGKSFSNTVQTEFSWEIRKRLDMRIAYRYIDNQMQYKTELLPKYLLGKHRAFISFSYETKNQHWQFDYTTQYNGRKRMPKADQLPHQYHRADYSPEFFNLLGQITYKTGSKYKLEMYAGVENALNVQQHDAIVSADNPFGEYFDASRVWGPVYGRMIYGGVRMKIK